MDYYRRRADLDCLSAVETRKIENRVDEPKQMLLALLNAPQIAQLRFGERSVDLALEQLGVANPVQLLTVLPPPAFVEECGQRFSREELRFDPEQSTGGEVRFADGAIHVGHEIGVGREIEERAVLDSLLIDGLAAGDELFILRAQLLVGDAQLFDQSVRIFAGRFLGGTRRAGSEWFGPPLLRSNYFAHSAREISEFRGGRFLAGVHHLRRALERGS